MKTRCSECGKRIVIRKSDARSSMAKKRFCSNKCRLEHGSPLFPRVKKRRQKLPWDVMPDTGGEDE